MSLSERRRFSRWLLLLGLAAAVLLLLRHVPRHTEVEVALGDQHIQIVEVRVAYVQQDEEMYGARLFFPEGAPRIVRHEVSLPPGRYQVRLELRRSDGGSHNVSRTLQTPTEGPVRIRAAPPKAGQGDP